jgi:hypothetical protein
MELDFQKAQNAPQLKIGLGFGRIEMRISLACIA